MKKRLDKPDKNMYNSNIYKRMGLRVTLSDLPIISNLYITFKQHMSIVKIRNMYFVRAIDGSLLSEHPTKGEALEADQAYKKSIIPNNPLVVPKFRHSKHLPKKGTKARKEYEIRRKAKLNK